MQQRFSSSYARFDFIAAPSLMCGGEARAPVITRDLNAHRGGGSRLIAHG